MILVLDILIGIPVALLIFVVLRLAYVAGGKL
jgi:hypothetical protein